MSDDVKDEEIFVSADFDYKSDEEDANSEEKENSLKYMPSSTSVIEEEIQPSKAFQIFAGKLYDPSSLHSQPERIITASSNCDARFESPLQKYTRLKHEISDYQNELQQIVEQANKEQTEPTQSITNEISKDLNILFSTVEDFKSNPQLAKLFLQSNNAMLDTVDPNYLFQKLAAFQSQQLENTSNQSNDRAVFTLYHDGSVNNKTYRIKEIEERVAVVEKILGPAPENPTVGPMMRSVEFLNKRLELLSDSTKLHGLERRAEVLRKKLQEITAKTHSTIELQITKTKEEKINKLFEMMCRWDECAVQLPSIVRRMQSIANLHEESANVVNKVEQLDIQNKLIQNTLSSNQNTLSQLHASLVENNQIIMGNLKSIEMRITSLQSKVSELK